MLLPSPEELKKALPASPLSLKFIDKSRETVAAILSGLDRRRLLIVGPCSIHHPQEALQYATRLKELADDVSDSFFIVMRAHCEKPRTTVGWKGLVCDPFLDGSYDIAHGLYAARQLLIALADMGVPAAAEFVEIPTPAYLSDLVTWGVIGARTAASQPHREMASGLPMPVGFKNGTDGNLRSAINGILSARHPHTFMGINSAGRLTAISTEGNPHGHLVLRGSDSGSNYEAACVAHAAKLLQEGGLPPRLLVDCSHDNGHHSQRDPSFAFLDVIAQCADQGKGAIAGLLIESYLCDGAQLPSPAAEGFPLQYGLSVTDPCLGWEKTAELIRYGHKALASVTHIAEGVS